MYTLYWKMQLVKVKAGGKHNYLLDCKSLIQELGELII
jgi:hypothetical protein